MGNLILAGGGDEHDSVEADDLLAALCDGNRTMLYVPIAMGLEHEPFEDARAWIGSVFGRRGFEITAWWGQWSMSSDEMNGYGAIYLGGGNTYRLRHWLWQQRLAEPIRSFLSQGGVIYGGSAGAIALGSDIRPCAPFDEDVVKDRRFGGSGVITNAHTTVSSRSSSIPPGVRCWRFQRRARFTWRMDPYRRWEAKHRSSTDARADRR